MVAEPSRSKHPDLQHSKRPVTEVEGDDANRNETVLRESREDSNERSTDHPRRPKSGEPRRKAVLITLDGMRVSERFVIDKGENYIGRDSETDIKISDGEVSRRHAVIRWLNQARTGQEDPVCSFEDLGSTNGSEVNGETIEKPVLLYDGDLIKLGRTVVGYYIKDERVLELDQLLLNMALHDALTGVNKREYFFSELHREFERARRHGRELALALFDLDFFKKVNDVHGHLAGDEALKRFAAIMRFALREGDISGRYGGEEFAVLFPETNLEGAFQAVERIRERVRSTDIELPGGAVIRLTVSCGLASLQPSHGDKMELLETADEALLEAKRTGRDRTVCIPRMSSPLESTVSRR